MTPIQAAMTIAILTQDRFAIEVDAREVTNIPSNLRKDGVLFDIYTPEAAALGSGQAPVYLSMYRHGIRLEGLRFNGKTNPPVFIEWGQVQGVSSLDGCIMRPSALTPPEPNREPEEKPNKGGLRLV